MSDGLISSHVDLIYLSIFLFYLKLCNFKDSDFNVICLSSDTCNLLLCPASEQIIGYTVLLISGMSIIISLVVVLSLWLYFPLVLKYVYNIYLLISNPELPWCLLLLTVFSSLIIDQIFLLLCIIHICFYCMLKILIIHCRKSGCYFKGS